MIYQIEIDPRDKLFFRDARPMGGSSEGSGAFWPMPSVFHSALLTALRKVYEESWESQDHRMTPKEEAKNARFQLGGLKTWGPFPFATELRSGDRVFESTLLVPTPADIESDGSLMRPARFQGESNLPSPLRLLVANTAAPTKNTVGAWIPLEELERYLEAGRSGAMTPPPATFDNSDIFSVEAAPGVGIDPETRANIEHIFFQAEYMRLKSGVAMAAFAECDAKKRGMATGEDVLRWFFGSNGSVPFTLGGQSGVAYLDCLREHSPPWTEAPEISSTKVKWTLLSPAFFASGWHPGWIDGDSGAVKLKVKPPRNGVTRREWRKQLAEAPEIKASLVAARIPKPVAYSGWKLDKDADHAGGGPKATKLLVPAGSVFYFECGDADNAKKLVEQLHGAVKSDSLGEHGFGLGVCSEWQLG